MSSCAVGNMVSDHHLAAELLATAGLGGLRSLRPVSQRSVTNVISLAATERGERYIYKRFTWPYDVPDTLNRRVKESFLHEILLGHQVRVPRIVASARIAGHDVHLMEYIDGSVLGDLATQPSMRRKLTSAWREVGATMAAIHGIEFGRTAGVISGTGVAPFPEGSWAAWFGGDLRKHASQVRGALPDHVLGQLGQIADLAAVALRLDRPVLLHNDPHAWNIIVAADDSRFHLAAWLDWEFAWAGDRWWDLARMAVFRLAPIGKIPSSFERGYGTAISSSLRFDLYLLCVSLWMYGQFLEGDDSMPETYRLARNYVRRLPAVAPVLLERLRSADWPLPER